MNRSLPVRLLFPVLPLSFLILSFGSLDAQPGQKKKAPPPPAPKLNPAEIKALIAKRDALFAQAQKIEIEFQPRIVQATERHHLAMVAFDQAHPVHALLAEKHQLHLLEQEAIEQTIDPAKLKAIRTAFRQKVAQLDKEYAPIRSEIASWNREKEAKIQEIQIKWEAEIAKINPPENRLEVQLHFQTRQEQAAIHQLLDQTKEENKDLIAKFETRLVDLKQKFTANDQYIQEASTKLKQGLAQVDADLTKQLAKSTSDEAKDIAKADADVKRETLKQEYEETLKVFNPPDKRIEKEMAKVREEEAQEINSLVDPAKLKAIRAQFAPQIKELESKIRKQDEERKILLGKMAAEIRAVEVKYDGYEKSADPGPNNYRAKLNRLKKEESEAIKKAKDPVQIAKIQEEFRPKFLAIDQKIQQIHLERHALKAKQELEMRGIQQEMQQKIAPLMVQIQEVTLKLRSLVGG